ncbi:helix-turn-helix domain-containing protein [Microvirga massiliensis]|uniref:helix-turn-helix domain-containing protein n=1 Tax=Microvirga massiliensis TaxID=1033741 RepID=UPI003CC7FA61
MQKPSRLLTIPETAEILGMSVKTVTGHINAGRLPSIAVGNGQMRSRRRIHPDDLQKFFDAQRRIECQSTSPRTRRFGTMTFRSDANGFTDLLERQKNERQRPSSGPRRSV